jgi:hypothetical protein
MSKRQTPVRQDYLAEPVDQLLQDLSQVPLKHRYCPDCGLLLQHTEAQFRVFGTAHSRRIPLPYCAHCHFKIPVRSSFAA